MHSPNMYTVEQPYPVSSTYHVHTCSHPIFIFWPSYFLRPTVSFWCLCPPVTLASANHYPTNGLSPASWINICRRKTQHFDFFRLIMFFFLQNTSHSVPAGPKSAFLRQLSSVLTLKSSVASTKLGIKPPITLYASTLRSSLQVFNSFNPHNSEVQYSHFTNEECEAQTISQFGSRVGSLIIKCSMSC